MVDNCMKFVIETDMKKQFLDVIINGARVGDLSLEAFACAGDMTDYEMSIYETIGDDELDRLGVETLNDLYGDEWANAFFKVKNRLLAKSQLVKLYEQRDVLFALILEKEKLLSLMI